MGKKVLAIRNRIVLIIIEIAGIVASGTMGYMVIEGWSFLDSFFMTIITITTVGFEEVKELSPNGQIFTILLIFSSLGIVTYGVSVVFKDVIEGNFIKYIKARQLDKMLNNLVDHYIVCGAGQTGKSVVAELQKAKVPYVIIETDREKVESLQEQNIPIFHGDATHDEVLEKMQIKKAKGVITVLDTDADNVFTVLSCRQLNPKLHIVARSIVHSSEAKLIKAGADVVVSPNQIGGQRMAVLAINTVLANILDIVTNNEEDNLPKLLEIKISPNSNLAGQSIQEANVRVKTGLTVLAIIRGDEKILNPSPEMILQSGDLLLVIGSEEQVKQSAGIF